MVRRWSLALFLNIPFAGQGQIIPDTLPRRLPRDLGMGHVACI